MVCSDTSLKENSLDILAAGLVLDCGSVGGLLQSVVGVLVGEYQVDSMARL